MFICSIVYNTALVFYIYDILWYAPFQLYLAVSATSAVVCIGFIYFMLLYLSRISAPFVLLLSLSCVFVPFALCCLSCCQYVLHLFSLCYFGCCQYLFRMRYAATATVCICSICTILLYLSVYLLSLCYTVLSACVFALFVLCCFSCRV